jgi:hypothetical protein
MAIDETTKQRLRTAARNEHGDTYPDPEELTSWLAAEVPRQAAAALDQGGDRLPVCRGEGVQQAVGGTRLQWCPDADEDEVVERAEVPPATAAGRGG